MSREQLLAEWRKNDDVILDATANIMQLHAERQELIERLAEHKSKFRRGDYSPGSVLARRAMSDIFNRFDELLKRARPERERIVQVMRASLSRHGELGDALKARAAEIENLPASRRSERQRHELERAKLWLEALHEAEEHGPHRLVMTLMGKDLLTALASGWGLIHALDDDKRGPRDHDPREDERRRRRMGDDDDRGDHWKRDHWDKNYWDRERDDRKTPDGGESPERLRRRIHWLERMNERSREMIEKRTEEIERLRAELEQKESPTEEPDEANGD